MDELSKPDIMTNLFPEWAGMSVLKDNKTSSATNNDVLVAHERSNFLVASVEAAILKWKDNTKLSR